MADQTNLESTNENQQVSAKNVTALDNQQQPVENQLDPTSTSIFRYDSPNRSLSIHSYLNISEAERRLLVKFENDIVKNEDAINSIKSLKPETQEKYLYQIKRYIRFCANKGLDNFIVTADLAKELIVSTLSKKRDKISENTVKSIRSPLNKLYYMNKLIYSTQQPNIVLGDQFIQDIMSNLNKLEKSPVGGSSSTNLPLEQTTATATTTSTDTGDNSMSQSKRLLPNTDDTEEIVTPSSSSSGSIFKLSESTKHKLNKGELDLLKKFDQEVLESTKTKGLLDNLTMNTFKAYATDIKRFVRFSAKQGKDNFLIDQDILTNFLTYTVNKTKKNNLKNLRTSLLKLHQLNCLAYDLDYSEGEIIFVLNKFLESVDLEQSIEPNGETVAEKRLLAKLEGMYKTSNVLSGLSVSNKRLYVSEFNRYASFCNREEKLDNFKLTGDLIKAYYEKDIILKTPNISVKKLQEILTRLKRLHVLNVEKFPDLYSEDIENFEIVKEFLKEYEKTHNPTNSTSSASDNGDDGPSTNSGASSSVSSLGANVPPLIFTNDPDPPALPQPAPVTSSVSDQSGDSNHTQSLRKPSTSKDQNYLRHRGVMPNYAESSVGESSSSSGSYRIDENVESDDNKITDELITKRQKVDSLPETNKNIPQFVMNSNIKTVTQLVEEWSLILKRTEKWGLDWIKDLTDFQLYNSRKTVADFLQGLLPILNETAEGKSFNQIEDDLIYEIAKIFDQYMDRMKINLPDLINKIETYPVYTKKEFSRILNRRKQ
ncbi:unnamed protein product [Candida verbasci]|uniref:Transcription activator GCR1-like domain-containing protein n=1 Tax=Candida verbasci TaxID=1227364 RepID=A0A9W4TP70_9ASCO|nr:unnamed protein product [Candida verbasci]